MRPPRSYAISIEQIEALADALCRLDDGRVHAQFAHSILIKVLGVDEQLVYAPDDGSESL